MKSRHTASKYDSRKPDHFRFKPSRAAHGKSIGGAAKFVRKMFNAGASKGETFRAVLEKWPKFRRDLVGFESRWNMAKKVAKAHSHN